MLERFSTAVTRWTGGTSAFVVALGVIVVWAVTGPLFAFSDTWQLVINTGTTIVTFLMVFLIQRAQNKDSRAIHLKLNELVAAMKGASNRLIDAEDLTEDELELLHQLLPGAGHAGEEGPAPLAVPLGRRGQKPAFGQASLTPRRARIRRHRQASGIGHRRQASGIRHYPVS